MAHKTGLAIISLEQKNIPETRYFNSNETSYTDNGTYPVTASSTFSGNMPLISGTTCYAIVKKNTNTVFQGTGTDGWAVSYTANIDEGCIDNSFTAQSKRQYRYKGWVYEYAANNMYSRIITQAGSYKLEVYGAEGGNSVYSTARLYQKGGYSVGSKQLAVNSTLYICVGGKGGAPTGGGTAASTSATGGVGGYNGGGRGGNSTTSSSATGGGGGGGATHIAITTSGTLYSVLNNASTKNNVLIVAGGGGGASGAHQVGGTGGGTSGGSSQSTYKLGIGGNEGSNGCPIQPGGSSSNYYQLGQGQPGFDKTIYNGYGTAGTGGGGGGYYGGVTYQGNGVQTDCGGGGGSGYIGGVTGGTTSNGVRENNGYARITTNFEWAF